ncbi:MAG: tRNA/rRNA methyltransferase (SpoU) [Parcubacteria group bacterium GW2011_GWA2_46_7]|nr:MAG: tRNA/rRNA methyltransferase (SpoU) [Parcubacteria group bacterium GW2011_GWA2_46_7]
MIYVILDNGKELAKTALGAEGYVPWEKVKQTGDVIRRLKQEGFRVIALEQDRRAINIRDYRLRHSQKYALIVGYEVRGIDKRILSRCDKIIYIPMFGKKESLNVSVAFGVAGYLLKFKKQTAKSKNIKQSSKIK